jgi:hypothetical protein
MGDPSGPELHRDEILALLQRHRVEFLMVGGQAATAYGAQRPTADLDIVIRWSPENLDRMGQVLVEADAGARVEGMADAFKLPHRDGQFLAGMELSTWRSPLGDVDVLRGLPSPHGEIRYDDLLDRAENLRIDDYAVMVASLNDVIVSKETTNRPSDIAALPELRQLRANAQRHHSTPEEKERPDPTAPVFSRRGLSSAPGREHDEPPPAPALER